MEIMLSHFGIGMAYDALDGLNIHAQRLHLRHIGVAAAVRCEQADIARFLMAQGRTFSGTGISRILSLDFGLPMLTVPFTTFTACRM